MKTDIVIVGATGNVGRKVVELLISKKIFPPMKLKLFASEKSIGEKLVIQDKSFLVQDLTNYDFKKSLITIFTTDSHISKQYVPKALEAGSYVIDSSSLYRLDPSVPLIVPPINLSMLNLETRLISTANCLACPMAILLKPLFEHTKISRVIASTFQSVSGAGLLPMQELYNQTRDFLEQTNALNESLCSPPNFSHFSRPIAFNVIPQIDKILEDGSSYEEFKITQEVKKLISPSLKINVTAVRVPVMVGHGMALSIEFESKINFFEIHALLESSKGIKISSNYYHTPLEVQGKDDVYVGRLRLDNTVNSGIMLWLVSDNLRRGASLDIIEAAEKLYSLLN